MAAIAAAESKTDRKGLGLKLQNNHSNAPGTNSHNTSPAKRSKPGDKRHLEDGATDPVPVLSKSIITFKNDMGKSQVVLAQADDQPTEKMAPEEPDDDDEDKDDVPDDTETTSPEPRHKKTGRALQTSPKRGQ